MYLILFNKCNNGVGNLGNSGRLLGMEVSSGVRDICYHFVKCGPGSSCPGLKKSRLGEE